MHSEKEKRRDKHILRFNERAIKRWIMMVTVMLIVVCTVVLVPQMFGKKYEVVGNQRKNWDHPDQIIVKIGNNIEKSPGDLTKLAISQTPVKDYQLTSV